MIRFDILTIFPEMFDCYFSSSMLARAQKNKKIKIKVHNLRDFAVDKHKTTDDVAYGGISGMVMKVEPIFRAVTALKKVKSQKSKVKSIGQKSKVRSRVILLSAKGKVLTQAKVRSLAKYDQIILIAGHYKGVDERVAKYIADEELSIGEYVITGGEVPSMVVVDAVSRMIEGVIGKEASKEGESFSRGVKYEHGVYTRPEIFRPLAGSSGRKAVIEWRVPEVLISGHHKKITVWREAHRHKISK